MRGSSPQKGINMKGFQFKYRIEEYGNEYNDNTALINIHMIAQIPVADFKDCEWTDSNTYYSVVTAPNKNKAIHIFKTRLKNNLNSDINIHHERWDA